jgi:hypothetical protein
MKRFKIIETNDYILAISDEEIKEGDWYYDSGDVNFICKAFAHTTQQYQRKKIIAYEPKNNAPELDLPLLPELVVEADKFEKFLDNEIELKLSSKETIERIKWYYQTYFKVKAVEDDVEKLINKQINDFKHDLVESTSTYVKQNCEGAIFGLKRLKESYKAATKVYSEEDLRKAIDMTLREFVKDYQLGKPLFINEYKNNAIQSLKQPKTPKWFVAEKEYLPNTGEWKSVLLPSEWDIDTQVKLKTTTINGKTYLVGHYDYK